jgi:hypothetical protein
MPPAGKMQAGHACDMHKDASGAGPAEAPPELHISMHELQNACMHATPATSITLLQKCQALVTARWQSTLDVLPAAVHRLVHLRHLLRDSGTFEKQEVDQMHGDEVLAAMQRHAGSPPLQLSGHGQLRLSVPEASELCQVC